MFTDSHCHLLNEYYEDIELIIKSAKEHKVDKYINNATNIASCLEVIATSKKYDSIYYTLGIHPESVLEDYSNFENILIKSLSDKKFVGIGEIGLDYHYGKETKEEQIKLFEYQLSLAEKYNLPVVIHSREATEDTLSSIKKFKVKGVLHCFNGSLEIAREYIKLGFYFGVNGVITFKNAKLYEVIREIPIENILLETDSPYLTPEPFRKYSNEPKYILVIAEYLANLYNISLEEVSFRTEKNIANLFDI